MRELLADIPSTVPQGILDNLYKGMDLPGKPQKLVDHDTKTITNQEKLEALVAIKKSKKHDRIRKLIHERLQIGIFDEEADTQNSVSGAAKTDDPSTALQDEDGPSHPHRNHRGGGINIVEESNEQYKARDPGFYSNIFVMTKETG
ncbi:hypothetical protein AYI70_g4892 [Smittium culicis]|uniref:Uncharacterized protein n=1 Tax=Smittium culicis TaxID=133412 RepID=A0A1R1XWX7_9FUNG|nr:hypothetical protein AYI70_g4892 [Smittium culicis]